MLRPVEFVFGDGIRSLRGRCLRVRDGSKIAQRIEQNALSRLSIGRACANGLKAFARLCSTRAVGESGVTMSGWRFEFFQADQQLVIRGVRNSGSSST